MRQGLSVFTEIMEMSEETVLEGPNLQRRLAGIPWRDLVPMSRAEGLGECLHPLPWLLASWACAEAGLWAAAVPTSFMFFLTALRLNHEAIHRNLGLSVRGHRAVLHALSALMLGSNHAVAANHLRHHAKLGTSADIEGTCGRMNWARVLAYGPLFPIEMHRAAWRDAGPPLRRAMRIDCALNLAAALAALLAAATGVHALLYHLGAMAVAQCLTAFFAVWITHRGCHGEALVARTQRSQLVNLLTYNMFFHLEHHLFPGVPVKRLGLLARRLDAALPTLAAHARRVI
jgi:fatty acid desaturase